MAREARDSRLKREGFRVKTGKKLRAKVFQNVALKPLYRVHAPEWLTKKALTYYEDLLFGKKKVVSD